MKQSERKCLVPECKKMALTRGLCHSCCEQARRAVREKITTWDALEKLGLSLHMSCVGKVNIFREALKRAEKDAKK